MNPTPYSPSLSPLSTPFSEHELPYFDYHGINSNIIVILAAIFCAFVCALGLNTMLQCIFQCATRAVTESVRWASSRRLNSGLKKKDVVALPTSTYKKSGSFLSSSSSSSTASGCPICLMDFSEGDKIKVLPKCTHRFHVICIDKWLLSHSSCPTCRHRVKSNDTVPSLDQLV